jgi:RHS repeat-associated protein
MPQNSHMFLLRNNLARAAAFIVPFLTDASGQTVLAPRLFESGGLLDAEIDGEGNASLHRYGSGGSLRAVDLPEGLSRTFQSSQAAALPRAVVFNSADIPEQAPATGAAATGSASEYGGGSMRRCLFVLGPDANLTEFREGNIVTSLTRDANGQVTRLSLPSGHRFDHTYDARGNLIALRDVLRGGTISIAYDPVHNLPVEFLYPDGAVLRAGYDAQGNPVSRTSPAGRTRTAAYGPDGQISTLTNELGSVSTFIYGAAGNLAGFNEGAGASQRTVGLTRDGAGRIVRVERPEGLATSYDYFPTGGLREFTDSALQATSLQEDGNGQITALLRPGGAAAHAWTYDGLRRASSYTPPGQPAMTYRYNVHSETVSIRVNNEDTATFAWNDCRQMTSRSESAPGLTPLTLSYLYNTTTTGQMTRADSSDNVRVTPAYSGEITHRLTWSGGLTGSFGIEFDNRYRITANQAGSGVKITYTYDADNLLLSAGAMTITRHPQSGLVTQITLGSVEETFDYNTFGELVAQTASANGIPFFSAFHTRDRLGRITETMETAGGITTTVAFSYDAAGRIATARRDGAVTESYTYDARGNLLSDHFNGSYTYNDADQLLTAGGAAFTYTATGERLARTRAGVTATFRYSVHSTLRGVDLGDGRNVAYQHDGAGNRAVRTLNGGFHSGWLCPDLNRPVAILNASGQITARYVHGLSENTPDYILQGGNTFRLITDHIGSVRFVIDTATGAIVQQRTYDAYGRTLSDSAPGLQPFGFAGGWTDPDTGLIRFAARDYDPDVRRWTTPDPIYFASGSLNNYAYVSGDPVNRFDPSGLNEEVKRAMEAVAQVYFIEGDGPVWISRSTANGPVKVTRAQRGTPVFVGDVITAGPDTVSGIQFVLGGRVGVKQNRSITIVNEGQAHMHLGDGEWGPIVLNSGGAWAKFQKQEVPLRIQTRGGGARKG